MFGFLQAARFSSMLSGTNGCSLNGRSVNVRAKAQLAETRYTYTVRDMQKAWLGEYCSQGAPAGLKRQRNAIRRILLRAPAANSGKACAPAEGEKGKSEFVLA